MTIATALDFQQYTKAKCREEVAAAHRICALLEIDDLTYTHISGRLPTQGDHYCIGRFGALFEEVTASSLIEIPLDENESGEELQKKEPNYNKTGYMIHGHIYRARPDVNCIMHLHTPAGTALSGLKHGLLPISQWALHLYDLVGYHGYKGLVLDEEEGEALVRNLDNKKALILENHGVLTVGRTPQEAMFFMYHLEMACRTQQMLLSQCQSIEDVVQIPEQVCAHANNQIINFEQDLGRRDWEAWVRKITRMDPTYKD